MMLYGVARIHHVTVINVHDLLDEIALIEQAAALIDVLRSDAVDGLLGVEIGLVFARAPRAAQCTLARRCFKGGNLAGACSGSNPRLSRTVNGHLYVF